MKTLEVDGEKQEITSFSGEVWEKHYSKLWNAFCFCKQSDKRPSGIVNCYHFNTLEEAREFENMLLNKGTT